MERGIEQEGHSKGFTCHWEMEEPKNKDFRWPLSADIDSWPTARQELRAPIIDPHSANNVNDLESRYFPEFLHESPAS